MAGLVETVANFLINQAFSKGEKEALGIQTPIDPTGTAGAVAGGLLVKPGIEGLLDAALTEIALAYPAGASRVAAEAVAILGAGTATVGVGALFYEICKSTPANAGETEWLANNGYSTGGTGIQVLSGGLDKFIADSNASANGTLSIPFVSTSTDGSIPANAPTTQPSGILDGWSITYTSPGGVFQEPVQVQTQFRYYDAQSQEFVLFGGQRISASSVADMSFQSASVNLSLTKDSSGGFNGPGLSVTNQNGISTLTDLGTGNQVAAVGTVNASSLQPGQPVAVSTQAGTYHVDPATGNITDLGAIATTINGNTVTILSTTSSNDNGVSGSEFAVIQSTSAGAPSSNIFLSAAACSG